VLKVSAFREYAWVQQNVAVSKASGVKRVSESLKLQASFKTTPPPSPVCLLVTKDYYERNASAFETRHPALQC
jgi:hypothetical protein